MEDYFQDLVLDAEYQDYLYQKKQQMYDQMDYERHIEDMAYDQMCRQRWEDEQQLQQMYEAMKEEVEIDYI
jgi:hypothetical protein